MRIKLFYCNAVAGYKLVMCLFAPLPTIDLREIILEATIH